MKIVRSFEDLILIVMFAIIGVWLFYAGYPEIGQRLLDGLFGAVVMRMRQQ